MSAQTVLQELEQLGCAVNVDGDRLTVSPSSRLTDELRARIREHKPEILAVLQPLPASTDDRCPVCGEETAIEVVRERFIHAYCAEPRHFDSWSTTDGEKFADLKWLFEGAEAGMPRAGIEPSPIRASRERK